MNQSEEGRVARIVGALEEFSATRLELVGLRNKGATQALSRQIVESLRRDEYIHRLQQLEFGSSVEPTRPNFDPQKAAIKAYQEGNFEEAAWLTFLLTHFGRHRSLKWALCANVYAGDGTPWTWQRVKKNPAGFRAWLSKNQEAIKPSSRSYGFGNHRKYQSIDAWAPNGTGEAVETYVAWVNGFGSHHHMVQAALTASSGDATRAFEYLYKAMSVASFGRTAKFDYLTMLEKLQLAPISPGKLYLTSSTGPIAGAKLLIYGKKGGAISTGRLEAIFVELAKHLGVELHILEDAICNWQKVPTRFVPFRG
jgi:hypothetical protein